jgi:translocator protein
VAARCAVRTGGRTGTGWVTCAVAGGGALTVGVDARTGSRQWGWLAGLVVVTLVAAGAGAASAASAPEFYQALAKPSWAPPPSVFGPVWTVLYALMAAAAWLVVRGKGWRAAWPELSLYLVQLVVNAAWTWLFFALHSGTTAFFDIIVLMALVTVMVVAFWRTRPLAGILLLPYLAWVAFATFLTWSVWALNAYKL